MQYVLENQLAVEQRTNNELRARRHAIAAFRRLDMLMNGLVADAEQLSGIRVRLSASGQHNAIELARAQMRDTWGLPSCDSSWGVQCQPARRLKSEAAHILRNRESGRRYALSRSRDKIA